MASPNLSTECTATVQLPLPGKSRYGAESIIFDDRSSVSYEDTTARERKFKLRYENQTDAQRASFEAFWDARRAKLGVFYWNHPRTGELDIKVRFDTEEVEFEVASATTWNWSVDLVEVAS